MYMTFDEMLEELGELGKFQIINFILVCLPVVFSAANNFTYIFIAGKTKFRCLVPVCDDSESNIYEKDWLPNALPTITKEYYTPSECEMYAPMANILDLYNGTCSSNLFNQSILVPCNEWISKSPEVTIGHEWNIFCKDTWKLPFVGTVHFGGIVLGSGITGVLADRFGRKSIFVFCIIFMSISGVAEVFCPDYTSFSILVFINALATSGVYPLALIIGLELVGRQKREFIAVILNYFYTFGEMMVGVIAWIFPNWRVIQLIFSAPAIIFILYWWLIPESVRWLLTSGRTHEVKEIIEKVAETNGVILSKTIKISLSAEENLNETKVAAEPKILENVKQILRSCKMITRFLILLYIWIANVFVFYGLSINSVNMSGNKYLNFMLTSGANIPGYTLAWVFTHYAGRKWTTSGSFFLCCLSSITTIFIPANLHWLRICIYLCAKMFVASSFIICHIYTTELLPTIIRSGGVGVVSTISRTSAMIVPFVPFINPNIAHLPMVIFGVIAALGGILSLFLPETRGIKLPESVDEAKNL